MFTILAFSVSFASAQVNPKAQASPAPQSSGGGAMTGAPAKEVGQAAPNGSKMNDRANAPKTTESTMASPAVKSAPKPMPDNLTPLEKQRWMANEKAANR